MRKYRHQAKPIENNKVKYSIEWKWNAFDSLLLQTFLIEPIENDQLVPGPVAKKDEALNNNCQGNTSYAIDSAHFLFNYK
jgi:hypothetical protein